MIAEAEMTTDARGFMNEHAVRVLLVDDQPLVGETVRRMLAAEPNLAFRYLGDPLQAMQIAGEFAPTIILQDLVMPQIDGITLVKFFRANPATRDIPMVVLSTREEPVTKAEAFAAGANDYLIKLPDPLEMIARIKYHSQNYITLLQRNEAYQALAGVAHDIKNILTGIKGGAFLIDEALGANNLEMLKPGWQVVKICQDRIFQLVFNMLDYSKERTPRYETVDLEETLGNVRDLIELRGRDDGVAAALEIHPAARTVEAEGLSVHRCVLNLASNALDAICECGEPSAGKVTIRTRPGDAAGYLAIDVQDNGPGIPPEKIGCLFQAFSSSKGAKGTGLGLAVSKKIATEHHGSISVASTVGAGTTFTIHLPAKEPREE
jgi:signal transduction histidine kinase